ncbi:MAG: HPr-rel-A system PqqD family peptide chaperone [Leptospiraceae bacterium]|nr:HPr-rel-A system PqqD family peptide chaperone [Leptospiraceae bacterium]MCP5503460.1 HPr-rel-A system PqqD family peptide chaperone [Leptospiraceae bacterium]
MNYQKLRTLAISDTGFMFDPTTGRTYTLNETGIFIVHQLKKEKSREEIIEGLLDEYETEKEQAERDLSDFLIQLKELGISG